MHLVFILLIINGLQSEIRNNPVKNASSAGGIGKSSGSGNNSIGATLFVGGLPYDVSEDEVRYFLEDKIPSALHVRVPFDREKNSIKGIAFVTLGSGADVTSVIKLVSNLEMCGRILKINESKPRETVRTSGGSHGGFGSGNSSGFRGGDRPHHR